MRVSNIESTVSSSGSSRECLGKVESVIDNADARLLLCEAGDVFNLKRAVGGCHTQISDGGEGRMGRDR